MFSRLIWSCEGGVSVIEGLTTFIDLETFIPLSFADKMSEGYLIFSLNLHPSVVSEFSWIRLRSDAEHE